MNTVIMEPVDVIVKYKGTGIEIIKFKRGQTEYVVTKKGNSWIDRQGNNIITHYTLICEKQGICCELSHNHLMNKWMLVQLDVIE